MFSFRRPLFIVGTRPTAIKLAPVVLRARQAGIAAKIAFTGQHTQLPAEALDAFDLWPDIVPDEIQASTLPSRLACAIKNVELAIAESKPDCVFINGDTFSELAGALAAKMSRLFVFHNEAGLRTRNNGEPYPEEINRRTTAQLADYHFAPTETSSLNLQLEGILPAAISVVGNTIVDAVKHIETKHKATIRPDLKERISGFKAYGLITAHRAENFDGWRTDIPDAVADIVSANPSMLWILSVHPRKGVREMFVERLRDAKNVVMLEGVPYPEFLQLFKNAGIVLSDSGGVQEEAAIFGRVVLCMRNATERPECVTSGHVKLIGNTRKQIVDAVGNAGNWLSLGGADCPIGDGNSAERIVKIMTGI